MGPIGADAKWSQHPTLNTQCQARHTQHQTLGVWHWMLYAKHSTLNTLCSIRIIHKCILDKHCHYKAGTALEKGASILPHDITGVSLALLDINNTFIQQRTCAVRHRKNCFVRIGWWSCIRKGTLPLWLPYLLLCCLNPRKQSAYLPLIIFCMSLY